MTMYVHQVHELRTDAPIESLYDAVSTEALPLAKQHGVRLIGYWETVSGQGVFPSTVAVWEFDDFGHYVELVRQTCTNEGDRRLRRWQEKRGEWITRTSGLACFKSQMSPDYSAIVASGLSAKMCSHEIVHCEPARQEEYLRWVEEIWFERVARPMGRSIIGLYWSPWKNTRAINIWGQGEEWDDVVPFGETDAWHEDPDFRMWQTLGREIRTDWDDRFLVPAPFSTVR